MTRTVKSTLLSAILLSLVVPGIPLAQTTPADALLVLSKTDRTLAIIDPVSLKVLARIPVGLDPHEVVASADGTRAYVSNYGGGAYNTLAVIDLTGQKALPAVDLGALRGPHGLVFVAGKVWFTAEAAKAIGSYDPATGKIDWILGTGQNRTHMIDVSNDLKRIVTTNVSSGSVSVIEKRPVPARGAGPGARAGGGPPPGEGRQGPGGPPPAEGRQGAGGPPPGGPGARGGGPGGGPQEDWDQTVVPVGRGPEGFDVSPDAREIWAANAQDGTISIVDVAGKKVSQTLAANVNGANRLKFTPDGKLVLVSTLSGPDVAVFDVAARREVKRVKVGRGAAGLLMQPDGSRAFVACTPDGYVAVVDLKSLEAVAQIDAGPQPDGLAWATRR
jgi:DNA-binding beta-propeller fold protein YncE